MPQKCFFLNKNGTMHFEIRKQLLKYKSTFYLETSGGQNFIMYLKVIDYFNAERKKTSVAG
jgi:hypothetical protein